MDLYDTEPGMSGKNRKAEALVHFSIEWLMWSTGKHVVSGSRALEKAKKRSLLKWVSEILKLYFGLKVIVTKRNCCDPSPDTDQELQNTACPKQFWIFSSPRGPGFCMFVPRKEASSKWASLQSNAFILFQLEVMQTLPKKLYVQEVGLSSILLLSSPN